MSCCREEKTLLKVNSNGYVPSVGQTQEDGRVNIGALDTLFIPESS